MDKKKKRLMVTGLSGFVGRHILNMSRRSLLPDARLVAPDLEYDLLRPETVHAYVQAAQPDAVIHLAAQTFVPASFESPKKTMDINIHGTLCLLQALKKIGFQGRFLYISSGDVYGQVPPEQLPVAETQPIAPRNPYAVSKAAAELLCLQWNFCEAFNVLAARPFNHIGPGQSHAFVISSMARQVARIILRKQEPVISLGDVDVTRDFLHVHDVIYAYMALLRAGNPGEIYNVCSGREFLLRDLFYKLAAIANVPIKLTTDMEKLRKSEQRRVKGNNLKLINATAWRAQKTIDETLKEVLQDWIMREKNG